MLYQDWFRPNDTCIMKIITRYMYYDTYSNDRNKICESRFCVEPFESLETLDRHEQTHNDVKPQNFLVKFKNGSNDLTQIEIALTDFGMADADSKGGTPVYASPECFEKTDTKSDVFSFGRLILFLLLTKEQFMKWLYIPIKNQARISFRMSS